MKIIILLIALFILPLAYADTYKVMGEPHVNVRASPSTKARVVAKVEYGETVKSVNDSSTTTTVAGKSGKWIKIKYSNSGSGYVFDAFLRKITKENSLYTVIAKPHLNIRSSPNTKASIVGKVDYGDAVRIRDILSESKNISGKRGRWVKIQYNGNNFGYAFDAFLAKSSHNTKSFKMYRKGNSQYRKGNYYHAVSYYHLALENTTNEVEKIKVLGALSQVSKKEGNYGLAEKYARKILEADPKNEFASSIIEEYRINRDYHKKNNESYSISKNKRGNGDKCIAKCFIKAFGAKACSDTIKEVAKSSFDINAYGFITGPSCTLAVSKLIDTEVTGKDLALSALTGVLSSAKVNSDSDFKNALGYLAKGSAILIKVGQVNECTKRCD